MGHEHLLIFNGTQASLQLLTHDLVLASNARERQERLAERQRAALLAAGGTAVGDSAGQRAIGLRSKAESKAPMSKVRRLLPLVALLYPLPLLPALLSLVATSALHLRSRAVQVWSLISRLGTIDHGGIWQMTPSSVDLDATAMRAIVGVIERAQQELMRR